MIQEQLKNLIVNEGQRLHLALLPCIWSGNVN